MRLLFVFILFTASAAAQEAAGIRGESPGTRKRLAEAEQLLLSGKASESLETIRKVIDENGDDLILIDSGRYVSARYFAQLLLSRLPAEQLAQWRGRVEAVTVKLLDEGRTRRDTGLLQELVDRYFVSRPAEQALLLLGEFAFERGDYPLAIHYWSKLLPTREGGSYPDPAINPSEVRAKIFLASHRFRPGSVFGVPFDDDVSRGRLAGREGLLIDLLRNELHKPIPSLNTLSQADDWQMLGANASRSGCVPGRIMLVRPNPLWVEIIADANKSSPLLPSARNVAFHPVMDDQYAYCSSTERIIRYELGTGQSSTVFDAQALVPAAAALTDLEKPTWRDADFTVALASGRLYARLGAISVLPNDAKPGTLLASHIVCVTPPKGSASTQLHWARKPPVSDGIVAGWEGAPLVADGNVLAAFARVEGGRVVIAIACYGEQSEKPIWVTDVCEFGTSADSQERQELLTLAGSNIVFASQTGVIVAVNVRSGKLAWAHRYARVSRLGLDGRYRDISPPVASSGRVFVAPNDSDRIFAFDADNGAVVWKSEPLTVDHIIGISHGKVIAAIAGPQRGLRAFDFLTGKCDAPEGWQQHDDPTLATFGRGLIVDNVIAWPTQAGLYLIRIEDGLPARPLLREVHGNLAYADGKLLVASPKTLSYFAVAKGTPPHAEKPVTISMITVERSDLAGHLAPPAPEDDLAPVLSEKPSIQIAECSKRGASYQPPCDGEWAEVKGQPTLLATALPHDAVCYRKQEMLLVNQSRLSRASFKGQTRWQVDFTLPVTGLCTNAVRLGERHIARFDDETGKIVAITDTSRRSILWPHAIDSSPQFDEPIGTAGGNVVVRRSDGHAWYNLGDVEWPCPCGTWKTPPIRLDEAWAFATGPGTVSCARDRDPNPQWTFSVPNSASLAGIAPAIVRDRDALLVLIARNYGSELYRISLKGKTLWPSAAFLGVEPVDLTLASMDRDRTFVATPSSVTALLMGRKHWETELPAARRWQIVLFANAVVAVPVGLFAPPLAKVPMALLRRPAATGLFPVLAAVATVDPLPPVIVLDPETGAIRHRLNVPEPVIAVTRRHDGLWFATPHAIYRLK